MKRRTLAKCVIIILLFGFLGYYFLYEYSFERKITQDVSADVYVNGVETHSIDVTIDGKHIYNFLSPYRKELLNFYGSFSIAYDGMTFPEGSQVHIYSERNDELQKIRHYYAATPNAPFGGRLLISFDMTEFAIRGSDSVVISTSREMYERLIQLE